MDRKTGCGAKQQRARCYTCCRVWLLSKVQLALRAKLFAVRDLLRDPRAALPPSQPPCLPPKQAPPSPASAAPLKARDDGGLLEITISFRRRRKRTKERNRGRQTLEAKVRRRLRGGKKKNTRHQREGRKQECFHMSACVCDREPLL